MNETVKKWIIKAENDLKIGKDEMNTENPATDGICFHMEQCVEKYLKAYLIYLGKSFRKTHDIAELIELCSEIDPEFKGLYKIGAVELSELPKDWDVVRKNIAILSNFVFTKKRK